MTTFYDPMIAKLVVWAQDRNTALRKLKDNLLQYQVSNLIRPANYLGQVIHGFDHMTNMDHVTHGFDHVTNYGSCDSWV